MSDIISKELLSEVLDINYTYDIQDKKPYEQNLIRWWRTEVYKEAMFEINIYELAHKCKEWAYQNDYDIWSITWGACEVSYNKTYRGTERINADTEPEAIFNACQWILDNKDK